MTRTRLAIIGLTALLASAVWAGPKQVSLWVARNVAPGPKIQLTINTTNVPVVGLKLYRLEGEKWLVQRDWSKRPATPGTPVKAWQVTVTNPKQAPPPRGQTDRYASRVVNLPVVPPGIYLVSGSGGDKEAWGVVNVTNFAFVAKRSPKRALLWVVDAKTGQPVPGAMASLLDQDARALVSGKTGADGVALLAIKPGGRQTAVIKKGSDIAGVPLDIGDPDGQLRSHIQTDRPIYRPGQEVSFRAILRRTLGQSYRPVINQKVKATLLDPKSNPVDEVDLDLTPTGTVHGKLAIPEEGATGAYTIRLNLGKETAFQQLSVAEYRKPEFKIAITPGERRYLSGEKGRFDITAEYFFGAPLPQAAVTYTIRRSYSGMSWGYDLDDAYYGGDGNLYPRDTYGGSEYVAQSTVYTDAMGRVSIEFPTDPKQPDNVYSISVTVRDASNRQVDGSSSVPVYAANIRLALRPLVSFAAAGSLFPVEVRCTDLDGKPRAVQAAIQLVTDVYDAKKKDWVEKELTRTTVAVPASGKATIKLPALGQDNTMIRVKAPDGTGRTASAETSIWIVDPNYREPKAKPYPELNLRLDKSMYKPGDPVSAFVNVNRPEYPILVTVEGEDIWSYTVMPKGTRRKIWTWKSSLAQSPNAIISATQWSENGMRAGSQTVPLPDPARRLEVAVTPDRPDYRPGDIAKYLVTTKDAGGRPVAADVALGVVDEAIYALMPDVTPDLYRTYWGIRGNGVITQVSAPQELSGGAYQRANTLAPVRRRFEDTAYWNGYLLTGPDGQGEISFEMPGNLTAWRATGRAVTEATSVGTATSMVRANRPVMLRLATPRQMAVGDRIDLVGTINNRTNSSRKFGVSLRVTEGVLLSDAEQTLSVDANGQATVKWSIRADRIGTMKLLGQVGPTDATNADLSDALEVGVRVNPAGVARRELFGGAFTGSAEAQLLLPTQRIEGTTDVRLTVRNGLTGARDSMASSAIVGGRWGTSGAASSLLALAALGPKASGRKEIVEAIAALSRTHGYGGWGWWEGAPVDAENTAFVLLTLVRARAAGLPIPPSLIDPAFSDALQRFGSTNLWDHRALLASARILGGNDKARPQFDEVLKRGEPISPYGQFLLAEAAFALGDAAQGQNRLDLGLVGLQDGPQMAHVPGGEGVGWTAGDVETTAQALAALSRGRAKPELAAKLALWLGVGESGWRSQSEKATSAYAQSKYLEWMPEATDFGPVQATVAGAPVEMKPERFLSVVSGRALNPELGDILVSMPGGLQAFWGAEVRYASPELGEQSQGIRVLRRFEHRNAGGLWTEVAGPVKTSEPIRVTVLVWADEQAGNLRVSEPIPAAFEYIESENDVWSRDEVRDAAVIHFLHGAGSPMTFRYYLRAESSGEVLALPATAEAISRPRLRGQSEATRLVVTQP
ncbi:MAG: hypothetical protein K1X67_09125 [Fimbriimonadaceae bacterium]|nr:hypothetical protein [Fimbriimonadaceae bacterium]